MKKLTPLIKVSSKKAYTKSKIDDNKLLQLENLLSEEPTLDDDHIMAILFNGQSNVNHYRVLKHRLKQKLFKSILDKTSDNKQKVTRLDYLHEIQQKYTVATILMAKFERESAIELLEKTLPISQKYEHTVFTLLIARLLLFHYSFSTPNRYKMTKYRTLLENHSELFDAENKMYIYNAEISHIYILNRSGFTEKNKQFLEEYFHKIVEIHNNYDTYSIKIYSYDLISFYYLTMGLYQKVIETSVAGIEYFKNKPFSDQRGIVTMRMNIVNALIYLSKFDEAEKTILELENQLTQGSNYWLRLHGLHFILASFQKDFKKMYNIYHNAMNHKKSNLEHHDEEWLIRSAYLNFLIRSGKITPEIQANKNEKPFVLSKFLNSVPKYSKDKQGLNISIIIIQIIFLIFDKKWIPLQDKIDALNQYSYRYLTNDESLRSNCFIKMLLLVEKANFNLKQSRRYTASLVEKMKNSPYVLSENSAFIEVIPYEILWEIIEEMMENKNK